MPVALHVPGEERDAVSALVRQALSLGVGEAARRLAGAEHARPGADRAAQVDHIVDGLLVATDADQPVLGQLIKEVWGRGAGAERRVAARTAGRSLRAHAPHRALALARELAAMTSSEREADLVADEAFLPLLQAKPVLRERLRPFLRDSEAAVRRAATRALVASGASRRDVPALVPLLLELAHEPQPGDDRLLRSALRALAKRDSSAVARGLSEWGGQGRERAATAQGLAQAAGVKARIVPRSEDLLAAPGR